MIVYTLLFGLVLFLNYIRLRNRITNDNFYQIICCAFILIVGLRHPDVGADSAVYYNMFESARGANILDFLNSHRDWGFSFFTWLIINLGGNFTIISLLVAIIFYIPFFRLLKKYSYDSSLSLLVFAAFTFFQFTMTGMRQTAALGFSFLFIYELLNWKGQWIKCLLYFVLAYTFHKSSYIILFYPFIIFLCSKKGYHTIFYALIPVFLIFNDLIASFLLPILESEGFEFTVSETGGGVTTLLVYIVIFVYGLIVRRNKLSVISRFDTGLMAFIVCLQTLVISNSLFFRGVWYYSIFITIFVTKLVRSTLPINRSLVNTMFYLAMLVMYFGLTIGTASVLPYKFFWQ